MADNGIKYDKYINAALITFAVLAIAMLAIKFLDEGKRNSVDSQVNGVSDEMEKTRLLFLYSAVMKDASDQEAVCQAIDYGTKQQMDKGYYLVQQLKQYQESNLLSDYQSTQEKYFLSNFGLWLYTTQAMELCNKSEVVPILFFHETKTACPECAVQGEVLDSIRAKCSNVRIVTFPTDLNIDLISLVQKKYGVTKAPALVINNSIVLKGMQNEQTILAKINCEQK